MFTAAIKMFIIYYIIWIHVKDTKETCNCESVLIVMQLYDYDRLDPKRARSRQSLLRNYPMTFPFLALCCFIFMNYIFLVFISSFSVPKLNTKHKIWRSSKSKTVAAKYFDACLINIFTLFKIKYSCLLYLIYVLPSLSSPFSSCLYMSFYNISNEFIML